jgi:hypothetical protein
MLLLKLESLLLLYHHMHAGFSKLQESYANQQCSHAA